MRFKKVLLVSLSHLMPSHETLFPCGIGYLSESLTSHNIHNDVIDTCFLKSENEILSYLRREKPDLIGFSINSFGYKPAYEYIKAIKAHSPEIKVIAGGSYPSVVNTKVLEQCPYIDYALVGEGENALVKLCLDTPLDKIERLIYRDSQGRIIYNKDENFIDNLDEIKFPTYSKFNPYQYPLEIPILTSRGCPYSCIYCCIHSIMGRKWRGRSAESVLDELTYWYKRGYRKFRINDDNFTFSRERIFEICDGIRKRDLHNLSFFCTSGVRPDKVDREMLVEMKKVGFRAFAFGVESGSNKVLKNLKKGITVERIEETIKIACELGYRVYLFLLFGSPGETKDDLKKSIDLVTKYPVMARFHPIVPYPSSELFDWLCSNNYLLRSPEEYLNDSTHIIHHSFKPIFETPEMPAAQQNPLFRWVSDAITVNYKNLPYYYREKDQELLMPIKKFLMKIGKEELYERFFSFKNTYIGRRLRHLFRLLNKLKGHFLI